MSSCYLHFKLSLYYFIMIVVTVYYFCLQRYKIKSNYARLKSQKVKILLCHKVSDTS